MILRTRPSRISAARPYVAVAGVVVDDREVAWRRQSISASISSTGWPAAPKPPIITVEPSAIPATASRGDVEDLDHHG